jgi:hypothetical protein
MTLYVVRVGVTTKQRRLLQTVQDQARTFRLSLGRSRQAEILSLDETIRATRIEKKTIVTQRNSRSWLGEVECPQVTRNATLIAIC